MYIAKEAEMDESGKTGHDKYHPDKKTLYTRCEKSHPDAKVFYTCQLRGKCYEFVHERHYRRYFTKLQLGLKYGSSVRRGRGGGGSSRVRGCGLYERGQEDRSRGSQRQAFIYFLTHQTPVEAPSNLSNRWFITSGTSKHMNNNALLLEDMLVVKDVFEVR